MFMDSGEHASARPRNFKCLAWTWCGKRCKLAMDEAIEALHLAWERLERDVALLEHRVAQELVQRGDEAATTAVDPLQLIERLRGLRRALPALQADWDRTLALKHELLFVTQTILLANQMEIQQVVTEVQEENLVSEEEDPPVGRDSTTLVRHFEACCRQWQQALSEMKTQRDELSTFSTKRFDISTAETQGNENLNDPEAIDAAAPVWASQLAADAATESLHLAMVRAGVPLNTPVSPFATMNAAFDSKHRHSLPDEVPDGELESTRALNPLRDTEQTSADHEHPVSPSPCSSPWSSNGFVPIAKAAFQRLPLMLRRRVPSLDTLNQSYAKLFRTMSERECTVLSDAEAVELLGEGCRDQLEVLRGLAVLRRTRDGWMLAAATSGTRVPSRSHSGGSQSKEPSHLSREARPKSSPVPHGVSENVHLSSTRKHFVAPTPVPGMGSSGSRVIPTGTTSPKRDSQQPEAHQPARRTDRVSSVRRISRDPLDNVTIM